MTIKEFIYSTQQKLQSSSDTPFKRTHIYELLASAFGYNSYAALCSESIFTQLQQKEALPDLNIPLIQKRCIDLGYKPISTELAKFIHTNKLDVIQIDELIEKLRDITVKNMVWDNDIELSPFLLDNLESSANKGNTFAHYVLALINKRYDYRDEQDGGDIGSSYWYSQAQQGKKLSGFQKEYAEEYAQYLTYTEKYTFHLRESGRLGNEYALYDLLEQFEDPTFFEKVKENNIDIDPIDVAWIAETLNRHKDAKHWLTIAANSGDTEAMRRLINEFDNNDLQQCWVWFYLAQMMGSNLTYSNNFAIDENGAPYDDDVGGPIFVDDSSPGVKLKSLDETHDVLAKKTAENIFREIQQSV